MLCTPWALALEPESCENDAVTPTTPSSDFTEMGDGGVVRHETTGLEWQRCLLGQTWQDGHCGSVMPIKYTWQEALIAANAVEGWRLPNVKELLSIVELCGQTGFTAMHFNRQVFSFSTVLSGIEFPLITTLWSASPSTRPDKAWMVSFTGLILDADVSKQNEYFVRLVRTAN